MEESEVLVPGINNIKLHPPELPAPTPRRSPKPEIPIEEQLFYSHMTIGMLEKLSMALKHIMNVANKVYKYVEKFEQEA